jgi:hypothetical protein
MVTYLLHGFRWSRPLIRIHIAQYDLDDASAEWIILPPSAIAITNSFYTLFDFLPPPSAPSTLPPFPGSPQSSPRFPKPTSSAGQSTVSTTAAFNATSPVKLLEQYNPLDETPSQPYAYVGDYCIPVPLSADISSEISSYEDRQRRQAAGRSKSPQNLGIDSNGSPRTPKMVPDWLDRLREKLDPNAQVGWFVVVCDDEGREFEEPFDWDEEDEEIEREHSIATESGAGNERIKEKEAKKRGLRGLFGRKAKEKVELPPQRGEPERDRFERPKTSDRPPQNSQLPQRVELPERERLERPKTRDMPKEKSKERFKERPKTRG